MEKKVFSYLPQQVKVLSALVGFFFLLLFLFCLLLIHLPFTLRLIRVVPRGYLCRMLFLRRV